MTKLTNEEYEAHKTFLILELKELMYLKGLEIPKEDVNLLSALVNHPVISNKIKDNLGVK